MPALFRDLPRPDAVALCTSLTFRRQLMGGNALLSRQTVAACRRASANLRQLMEI